MWGRYEGVWHPRRIKPCDSINLKTLTHSTLNSTISHLLRARTEDHSLRWNQNGYLDISKLSCFQCRLASQLHQWTCRASLDFHDRVVMLERILCELGRKSDGMLRVCSVPLLRLLPDQLYHADHSIVLSGS